MTVKTCEIQWELQIAIAQGILESDVGDVVKANVSIGWLCSRKDGIVVAEGKYLEEVGVIVPTAAEGTLLL